MATLKLGFVGTGAIATAIATGLCSGCEKAIASVVVSPRSAKNAEGLAAAFSAVSVAASNQAVVDGCDIVFVCVLPAQLAAVLAELTFRAEQTLVSLVSTSTLAGLAEASKLAPAQVFKMICLPPVATAQGTCLLTPKGRSPVLRALFDSLGGTVECESEAIMQALMVPTCMMGPFYAILAQNRDWLAAQGVPAEDASFFLGRTYLGLAQAAEANCKDPQHFTELVKENTPGGLNEQAISNLRTLGVQGAYGLAMDGALERLRGQGDGERKDTTKL